MRRPIPPLLLGVVGLAWAGSAAPTTAIAGDPAPKLETTHLVRIPLDPDGVDGASLKVAPRSAHVVWRRQKEGSWAWVLDGKPGKDFADVGPLAFSDDGVHWAYFARLDGKRVLVVDGDERASPEPEPVEGSLRFVPGGAALAFLATRVGDAATSGMVAVVDGVAGPVFANIAENSLAFSRGGKRVAYKASAGDGERIVVDGKSSGPYPNGSLGRPRFSADGSRWLCEVSGSAQRLLLDGAEGPAFSKVTAAVFAPAGARYAYVAVRAGKPVVVIDGKEEAAMLEVSTTAPVFSADGAHVAYAARKADGWRVVIDGTDGSPFQRLGSESLQFSPDGKRHAYWAGSGPKPFFVIDGVAQKAVDLVGERQAARFSPDSKRFAYAARRGGKWVVVTDGDEGPETDGIAIGFPIFSPDSQHVVYDTAVGPHRVLFVDGQRGPSFDGFSEDTLAFGEDGATVGVIARRGVLGRIVIDGVEGEEYQALLPGSILVADGPRSFHAWFLRDQEILHDRAAFRGTTPR